jgi:hypothetical protein
LRGSVIFRANFTETEIFRSRATLQWTRLIFPVRHLLSSPQGRVVLCGIIVWTMISR